MKRYLLGVTSSPVTEVRNCAEWRQLVSYEQVHGESSGIGEGFFWEFL